MSKQPQIQLPQNQGQRQAPQGNSSTAEAAAAVVTTAAPADPAKLAEENARLRAELEELKAKASRPAPPPVSVSNDDRPKQRYRVQLEGAKVRHPLCPHCKAPQPMQADGKRDPMEKLRCRDCAREYLRGQEGHQMRNDMEVEAVSEGDAIQLYNRINGVITTTRKHSVSLAS